MRKFLEYEGYLGSAELSEEDDCFWGKIQFIDELILYDGKSITEIKEAFESAVDGYLQFCKDQGRNPSIPFKGSFNVRIGEDLHRRAAFMAKQMGMTMNDFIKDTITERVTTR